MKSKIAKLFTADNVKEVAISLGASFVAQALPGIVQSMTGKDMTGSVKHAVSTGAVAGVCAYYGKTAAANTVILTSVLRHAMITANNVSVDRGGDPLILPTKKGSVALPPSEVVENETVPDEAQAGVSDENSFTGIQVPDGQGGYKQIQLLNASPEVENMTMPTTAENDNGIYALQDDVDDLLGYGGSSNDYIMSELV